MRIAFANDETPPSLPRSTVLRIFLAALVVRWTYALVLYAFMGDDGLKGMDSIAYAAQAQSFAQAVRAGTIHGSEWLGQAPYTMPLYQWLTSLPFILFGNGGATAYILMQSAFDSGTCVLVYSIAQALDRRLALPSAIAAILNPTQIVLSGLIYTDTPFAFFVALSLFGATRWAHAPTWKSAVLLGCALGCAALIRVTIAPWGFFAIGMLAAFTWWRRKSLSRSSSLAITAIILCFALSTIAMRSHDQHGTFALTPQGGDYLALWVIPLVKEAQDRTPFATSFENIMKRTTQRFGPPSTNPFEQSQRYQQIGQEILREEIRISSLVASWTSGFLINLVSPAHLLSPLVSALPRTGFYETPGDTFAGKVFNFVFRSGNATYSWLLLVGTFGLLLVRAVQLLGILILARQRRYWPKLIFASSWIAFLLLLNGPIASPKYRLPLEPLFNIMTGAGIMAILDLRNRRLANSNLPTPKQEHHDGCCSAFFSITMSNRNPNRRPHRSSSFFSSRSIFRAKDSLINDHDLNPPLHG